MKEGLQIYALKHAPRTALKEKKINATFFPEDMIPIPGSLEKQTP